jgi:hypothetical protein
LLSPPDPPETPRDCALALAIPLTREAWYADKDDERMDFIRSWVASFPGYNVERLWNDYSRVAAYTNTMAAEADAKGVMVSTAATPESWGRLIATRRVVTLVAHWVNDAGAVHFEFRDGLARLERLIDRLPLDYAGVLDLTVCYSAEAIAPFKRARPGCTVLANKKPANLAVRLAMYRQIVKILSVERTTYVEAAMRVHLAALEVI